MKYFDELKRSMDFLAQDSRVMFLGQAVACAGTAMSNTLKDVSKTKLLELPVCEELQMGMTNGLALAGLAEVHGQRLRLSTPRPLQGERDPLVVGRDGRRGERVDERLADAIVERLDLIDAPHPRGAHQRPGAQRRERRAAAVRRDWTRSMPFKRSNG